MEKIPDDLPSMWQKPAFEEIMASLKSLRVDLPAWRVGEIGRGDAEQTPGLSRQTQNITAYLSSVIKSSLDWIQGDELKEAVWSEASKRFSERCGRTGACASRECIP